LVHSHWLLPQGFTSALAAKFLGRPHVVTVHGGDVFALRGPVSRAAKKLVLRLADAVTVNSEATRRAVLELGSREDKVVRIPMGAEDAAAPDPGEVASLRAALCGQAGPLLAFVGRLVPEKGAADLLEAVAILTGSLPGIRAVVIGDGPERDALLRQARALGIDQRIRLTGWLTPAEVRRHLRAADFFVGPSRPAPDGWVEAQGLTFIEAMLAERPVVASGIGGIVDAVRHEETGLLVAPGAPDAIAEAVLRLDGDREFARRLALAGHELARAEFTRAISAARFSALYARLAAGGDARLKM
jgi:glycosyltransferase involved in cell wall biosynthesis